MVYYYIANEDNPEANKMGCGLISQLSEIGCRAVLVSEEGKAPDRFMSNVAVVSVAEALARCRDTDLVLAGEPEGYQDVLDRFPCRAAYYETGTTSPPSVSPGRVLTALPSSGDEWAPVGFFISSYLYYDGASKFDDVVAYPKGFSESLLWACRERCPRVEFLPVGELHELNDAESLQPASVFVCVPGDRRLDLHALEAMAAGCVVLCGTEGELPMGLEHDFNAWSGKVDSLPVDLSDLLDSRQRGRLTRLRDGAVATASRYRPSLHREYLRGLMDGPLEELCS